MDGPAGGLAMRSWRPHVDGIREVFHARFTDHPYPPHTHDVWTLFIVDEGAIQYDLGRRPGSADPSIVSILPPYVVHDGRPATTEGYRKRVLYLEISVLGEQFIGPAVDHPVLRVEHLRERVAALHRALARPDDALEAETRFAFIVESVAGSLGAAPRIATPASRDDLAEQLRAFLDAHLFEPVTIAGAAAMLGASPTQVARSFSKTFGIAPHAYLVGRRLEEARTRILDGLPLADVAAEVGFYDQAHLSRRFRAYLGTAPGRFRRRG